MTECCWLMMIRGWGERGGYGDPLTVSVEIGGLEDREGRRMTRGRRKGSFWGENVRAAEANRTRRPRCEPKVGAKVRPRLTQIWSPGSWRPSAAARPGGGYISIVNSDTFSIAAVQRGRIPPAMHPYASALMFGSGDAFVASHAYLSSFISHLMRAEPYPLSRFGAGKEEETRGSTGNSNQSSSCI